MRFIHFSTRATYVVKPARKVIIDGIPEPKPGLRAKFLNHVFDSEKSQTDKGWSDDERKQVEQFLLTHPDFEHHRGFYFEDQAEKRAHMPATAGQLRCMAFFKNEEGLSEQCPNMADGESEYCDQHRLAAEALNAPPVRPDAQEVAVG